MKVINQAVIYNVIVKGYSVGMTYNYKEALGWLADATPHRLNCIHAVRVVK